MESHSKRFLIRQMKSEDIEEVARLLSKVFPAREPISRYLKQDENSFPGKQFTAECAKEELSFVCLDTGLPKGNQIVGFRLSQTLSKTENESKADENDNFNVIGAIMHLMFEYKNLWFDKHPEFASEAVDRPKCVFFLALGVKDGYENFGIASKLVEYSINHYKLKGYEYVFVIASAANSQHIFAKKYKFTEVTSKDYKNIEYQGKYFLKDITEPLKLISYELNLTNWDVDLHPVPNTF